MRWGGGGFGADATNVRRGERRIGGKKGVDWRRDEGDLRVEISDGGVIVWW